MEMLKDLLKKKAKSGGDEMDPKYKQAKMGVLKEISSMAGKSMGDDIRGIKKVEVASPDNKGLKEGLQKAQELVGKKDEPLDTNEMDDDAEDASDAGDDEAAEGEDMEPSMSEHGGGHPGKAAKLISDQINEESDEGDLSDEDIDSLIQELQAKKAKLSQK